LLIRYAPMKTRADMVNRAALSPKL